MAVRPELNLEQLVRPNILRLQPYRCARDENKGKGAVFFLALGQLTFSLPFLSPWQIVYIEFPLYLVVLKWF